MLVSRLTEFEKTEGHDELIFPCDCTDSHYLRMTWDDDDDEWRWLWIEADMRPFNTRERIKFAWRNLRGRRVTCGTIVLDQRSVTGIVDFLQSKLEQS